ncbi:response regulator [Cytophagales bacterium WSM2-2]|nr:response regulator [Cytophagales bacterium WSM2-2]
MKIKLKCIMLIDDNADDNFYHERVIKKCNAADKVIAMQDASVALEFLKSVKNSSVDHPDLIFLDINMPGMNGWEFLEEYRKLPKELQSQVIVIMLTTSDNPDDKAKALDLNIAADFKAKPLSKEMLEEIVNSHF